MKQQILVFLIRWALNALGLWVAVRLLGTGYDNVDVTAGFWGFVLAGLIFSVANSLFKPLLVIVSLPAILLTLGLFTIIVNGILVYISLAVASIPRSEWLIIVRYIRKHVGHICHLAYVPVID